MGPMQDPGSVPGSSSMVPFQAAGPWGQAFPEPQFDGRFLLREQRRLGGKHLKMVLSPESEPGKIVDAIAFNVPVVATGSAEDAPRPQTPIEKRSAYQARG